MQGCIVRCSCLFLMLITGSHARGGYYAELVASGPMIVGQSITVDVLLRETREDGTDSTLANNAMVSGDISFSWAGSSAFVVSGLKDYGLQSGRLFDNGGGSSTLQLDSTSKVGSVSQYDLFDSDTEDPKGIVVSSTVATIRLASFVVSGGVGGESVTFQLSDFDSLLDNLVLVNGSVLDGVIEFRSLTLTGVEVPEPTSIAVVGALLSGFAIRRVRTNRSGQQA